MKMVLHNFPSILDKNHWAANVVGKEISMNQFANAAVVATEPKTKKTRKPDLPMIEMPGVMAVAALDKVIKHLTILKAAAEDKVHKAAWRKFITDGRKIKGQPGSFKGVEGLATITFTMPIRGSNRPLSEDHRVLLANHAIPTTTRESRAECYIVNPTYTNDIELLKRVGAALAKVEDIPADFIQFLPAQSDTFVTEASVNAVFGHSNRQITAALAPIVCTMVPKPGINEEVSLDDSMAMMRKLSDEAKAEASAA